MTCIFCGNEAIQSRTAVSVFFGFLNTTLCTGYSIYESVSFKSILKKQSHILLKFSDLHILYSFNSIIAKKLYLWKLMILLTVLQCFLKFRKEGNKQSM
jgi:hypothetical protein